MIKSYRNGMKWSTLEKNGIGWRVSYSHDRGLIVVKRWFGEKKEALRFAKEIIK